MKIIADSGSTKTDWVLINDSGETLTYSSKGLNPNLVSEETIQEELLKLKKEFNTDLYEGAFYFYGSGCGSDQGKLKIEEALHKI
ncbi:MAG: N-acetylglucosamine kinase, partial [Marinilabiliales bacterium]